MLGFFMQHLVAVEPLTYLDPKNAFFFADFQSPEWELQWRTSQHEGYTGEWRTQHTMSPSTFEGEKMIYPYLDGAFGFSTKFSAPLNISKFGGSLVLQYEVRFEDDRLVKTAAIKLYSNNFEIDSLSRADYEAISFGPRHIHDEKKEEEILFRFRHRNPVNKDLTKHDFTIEYSPDNATHLYTLVIRQDNSFEILVDGKHYKHGNLLTSMEPPINPPKEVDDPEDRKPADWIDEEFIEDANATMPASWNESEPRFILNPDKLSPPADWQPNEPLYVPNATAVRPEEWDEAIFGPWEPPLVPNPKCLGNCGPYRPPIMKNPKYVGKWHKPLIPNPEYKGAWKPRKIPNPAFFVDEKPALLPPLVGIGFEFGKKEDPPFIAKVGFNNILVDTDEKYVREWNRENFIPRQKIQKAELRKIRNQYMEGFFESLQSSFNELKKMWLEQYEIDPIMTVVCTAVGSVAFLVIVGIALFGNRASPEPNHPIQKAAGKQAQKQQIPKQQVPKQQTQKPQEKGDDGGDSASGKLKKLPDENFGGSKPHEKGSEVTKRNPKQQKKSKMYN